MARILVVEQDAAVAAVLRELLENEGARVVVAPEPAAWSEESFDLAIVSLSSPTDPAIRAVRGIVRTAPSAKIVGIVADSRTDYDLPLVDCVFSKPLDVRGFLSTVRRLSARRRF